MITPNADELVANGMTCAAALRRLHSLLRLCSRGGFSPSRPLLGHVRRRFTALYLGEAAKRRGAKQPCQKRWSACRLQLRSRPIRCQSEPALLRCAQARPLLPVLVLRAHALLDHDRPPPLPRQVRTAKPPPLRVSELNLDPGSPFWNLTPVFAAQPSHPERLRCRPERAERDDRHAPQDEARRLRHSHGREGPHQPTSLKVSSRPKNAATKKSSA